MSPNIIVQDCDTQQFVKVFTKSEQLVDFLSSEKDSGVDIESKYVIYKFQVDQMFNPNDALDTIKCFGYLPNYDEYEAE